MKISQKNYYYLLTLPALIFLLLFNLYPLFYSLTVSFTNYNLSKPFDMRLFVGLNNYLRAFKDPLFLKAFGVSLKYTIGAVTFEFLIGLGVALMLNRLKGFGKKILTISLLPMMLTPIIVGLMWRFMFNYDMGIINFFIAALGLKPIPFLAIKQTAMLSLIAVDVWQWSPFITLLMYSGLQALPKEPYEAAQIDGASTIQMFFQITLPSLRNIIIISVLIRGMDALREYDKIFTMTYGGPANATETASFYIYRQGFKFFDIGYAAAGSYILLVIIIVVANILLARMKK